MPDTASGPASGRIRLERSGPVATVVIDRPERRNAMNLAMWAALGQVVREVDADADVRVVVLRGAGDQAFSAGGDIEEFRRVRGDVQAGLSYNRVLRETLDGLARLRKPLVAAIRGYCIGGGCEIAATADLRVCDPAARFGIPAARLGFNIDLGDLQRLTRLVGPAATAEMLLAGRTVTAERALQIGLVNAVVEPDLFEAHVQGLVDDLLKAAPLAVQALKADIRLTLEDPRLASVPDRDAHAAQLFDTEDYREAVSAFLEKRAPRFTGH